MRDQDTEAGFRWRSLLPGLSRRDLLEAAIIAFAFVLYFWVRGAVVDRPEAAYWHARDIIDVQRSLGFFWEDEMNRWIADREFWAQSMNIIYFYLHFPLIIAFGIWLYYYRRGQYTFVRDSFLASGAIALVIYWLYPVAPPRELPELAAQFDAAAPGYVLGFFDTMEAYLGYAYDTQSTRAFVNPYAAMPSLHFGWDLLLGIAVINAFRKTPFVWIAAPIGVALPTLQVFSITLTANHYLLDAVAGGIVAVAGLGVAWAIQRWMYPRLEERVRRLPWPSARRFLLPDEDAAAAG
ncbi:MAG TPA: phosphatase PAP2 family protein [Dehalococcoidia bacterium]|nr:phosphatase PAP2 family protein [Dehalococcoidia bacterium]